MKRAVIASAFALLLGGCEQQPVIQKVQIWPYDATKAPAITTSLESKEDNFLPLVIDYIHQTRHWPDGDFKVSSHGYYAREKIYLFEITYLPDQAKMPEYYTGASPNSFGVAMDANTRKFTKEVRFE